MSRYLGTREPFAKSPEISMTPVRRQFTRVGPEGYNFGSVGT